MIDMMIRKCDRCGKEIRTNDIKYYLTTQKSDPETHIKALLGEYDLCESCYTELNHFMLDYEVYNK